ncbi:MAG TPA: amino acid ABC transporter permease [Syntrophomonadaceae bacterium]|jgi:polar amino acid transport system permease protein|nr:amino acid ABC transporter permease [Syntrophomonadaceae bacterium]
MEYLASLFPFMMEGTVVTLKIFFISLITSLPLGVVFAMTRLSKLAPLSVATQFYIWLFRGTPLLLQLLFIYFGLPIIGINIDRFPAALLAFILNYTAYLAEVYRSGIQSIDRGQFEAADVLGLSRWQTLSRIILPQMIKRVLPPISNEVINLIKDTSLVYAIGISELLRVAKIAAVRDALFVPFIMAAIFYLVMTAVIQQTFKWLEDHYAYYR